MTEQETNMENETVTEQETSMENATMTAQEWARFHAAKAGSALFGWVEDEDGERHHGDFDAVMQAAATVHALTGSTFALLAIAEALQAVSRTAAAFLEEYHISEFESAIRDR